MVSFSKNQFNALFDFSSLKSIHVNFTKYFIGELILRIHICRVLSINFHVLNFVTEVHSQKSNLCCFLFGIRNMKFLLKMNMYADIFMLNADVYLAGTVMLIFGMGLYGFLSAMCLLMFLPMSTEP